MIGTDSRQWRHLSNDTVWPVLEHDDTIDSVAWRLIHAPEYATRGDILFAASVMSAYEHLIYHADRQTVALVRHELREGMAERDA
ncbi:MULTISPECIES: hypothetical protein [Nocardia]|uniref:hypothetical protein n=1 Tax=Nocardia TaxID=1817 RepID=UPI0013007D41|nr:MULTISPECIES: hypothetical protein [Nocardia]